MCWLICSARQGIKADGKLDKHFFYVSDFATPSLELDAVDRPEGIQPSWRRGLLTFEELCEGMPQDSSDALIHVMIPSQDHRNLQRHFVSRSVQEFAAYLTYVS